MFRTVTLSIIRSFSLYTQQYIQVCWQLANRIRTEPSRSCSQAVSKHIWRIPLLYVLWKTPGDGQRNFPKHLRFYSKNKFEKLVHLVQGSSNVFKQRPPWPYFQSPATPLKIPSFPINPYWYQQLKHNCNFYEYFFNIDAKLLTSTTIII